MPKLLQGLLGHDQTAIGSQQLLSAEGLCNANQPSSVTGVALPTVGVAVFTYRLKNCNPQCLSVASRFAIVVTGLPGRTTAGLLLAADLTSVQNAELIIDHTCCRSPPTGLLLCCTISIL